jgi:hypothetical protein
MRHNGEPVTAADVKRSFSGCAALMRTLMRACTAVLLVLSAPGAAWPETITVSIPVERDTMLMEAHPGDNDGAGGVLWPKWNGLGLESRVLLGFDLAPLAGRADDVVAATVVLRASTHTFAARGSRLAIHAMESGASVDWVEGDRRYNTFAYCSRRDLRRAANGTGGPGATWTCEDDEGPGGCATPWPDATPWVGGFASPGEDPAHLPRGARAVPTDTNLERRGYDPLCRQALSCFAATGSVECWRGVELDVTPDVREMLAIGHRHSSWLLRKPLIEAGSAYFFSREGAVCIMRIPDLRPQLLVTLVKRPDDPPAIPEPADHCEASRP